ncbi:hypothetical protein ACZ87_03977, partial [Candidatus Erwinia dacicola]
FAVPADGPEDNMTLKMFTIARSLQQCPLANLYVSCA